MNRIEWDLAEKASRVACFWSAASFCFDRPFGHRRKRALSNFLYLSDTLIQRYHWHVSMRAYYISVCVYIVYIIHVSEDTAYRLYYSSNTQKHELLRRQTSSMWIETVQVFILSLGGTLSACARMCLCVCVSLQYVRVRNVVALA